MSKLAIVGTVALDSIETPFGSGEEILGGSAVYSCLGASLFTKVGISAVVGGDFPETHTGLLRSAGVDTGGACANTAPWAWLVRAKTSATSSATTTPAAAS